MKNRINLSTLSPNVRNLDAAEMQSTQGGLKASDVIRLVRVVGCFLAGRSKRIRNSAVYQAIC